MRNTNKIKKKVIIFGNTGFVGSWLTELLLLKKYSIFGYSLKQNTKPGLHKILNHSNRIVTQFYADVSNQKNIISVLKKVQPNILIYLASQPLVIESIKNPKKSYKINIFGLINFFEAIRVVNSKSLKKVIVFTSDKVYKNLNKNINFKEESILGGEDPYSSSKACQDIISESYFETYLKKKISLIILRSGNIIGGGDWAENRIIPDLIRAIFSNKKVIIRNPQHTRPWQHVTDVIHAIEKIILFNFNNNQCQKFNIGPQKSKTYSVQKLLNYYKKFFNFNIKKTKPYKSVERKSLRIDSSRIRKIIKFKNIIDFNKMNFLTAKWYEMFYSGKNMIYITQKQILYYNKKVNK